jgi:hypothetical protein
MENQYSKSDLKISSILITVGFIVLLAFGVIWNKKHNPDLMNDIKSKVSQSQTEKDTQTIGEDTQELYMTYQADAEALSIPDLKAAIPILVENLNVQYKKDPAFTGDIYLNLDAYLNVYKKRVPSDAAYVDKIVSILYEAYGPCLGVPKEQCQ